MIQKQVYHIIKLLDNNNNNKKIKKDYGVE